MGTIMSTIKWIQILNEIIIQDDGAKFKQPFRVVAFYYLTELDKNVKPESKYTHISNALILAGRQH